MDGQRPLSLADIAQMRQQPPAEPQGVLSLADLLRWLSLRAGLEQTQAPRPMNSTLGVRG